MKTLLVVLLAWPINAEAVCNVMWDMALVSRALAEEKLPHESIVKVMGRIYNVDQGVTDILATMALADTRSASIFATSVRSKCQESMPKQSDAPVFL